MFDDLLESADSVNNVEFLAAAMVQEVLLGDGCRPLLASRPWKNLVDAVAYYS